ncbi:MAG: bifunctional 4-hydroxy-2-oxoglutarate aldolase/2-dehydro-3-deoxy-phosphogluconate aldolase [Gammaproteobacteria bacterium]|nr:bifunctional 4-hydroxy-2-oxoglutarate aldolase/2-dehydro-3-deoxy-phosphogluconate aldolase [Gammaproteobacteria bacterium]
MNTPFADISDRTLPVLPVIQVARADEIVPIAEALAEGGINALEITLRTDAGLDAIRLARQRFPDAVVCAGTVTNTEQLRAAMDAGAEFVVTPGITEALVKAAVDHNIPLLPGIATPSELMLGLDAGLRHFKLFPAQVVGGMAMLKSLAGPFPDVQFCPTGGLNADNYRDFLALPNVFCVGGSWMVVKANGEFQAEASAKAARAVAADLGGS